MQKFDILFFDLIKAIGDLSECLAHPNQNKVTLIFSLKQFANSLVALGNSVEMDITPLFIKYKNLDKNNDVCLADLMGYFLQGSFKLSTQLSIPERPYDKVNKELIVDEVTNLVYEWCVFVVFSGLTVEEILCLH